MEGEINQQNLILIAPDQMSERFFMKAAPVYDGGEAGITKAKCNGADKSQHVLYSNPVVLHPTHTPLQQHNSDET